MTIYLVSLYYKINERTGANIRFDETAKFLISKGWKVKLVMIEDEVPIWCKDKGIIIDFKNYNKLPSIIRRFLHFLQLSLLFLKIPKSIIINDFIPFSSLSLKKHYHYQIVHDVRNFTDFHRGVSQSLNSKIQLKQWQKSQKIITVSNFTRNELVRLCQIPKENIEIIYNGINQKYISYSENLDRKIDFLFIGVFEYRKNHKNLILALDILKKKGIAFNAECVGRDQGTLQEVKNLVASLDIADMVFINNTVLSEEDLIKKYNQSKVFVSPALYEGFGIPLIEAFASGNTVCCSSLEVFNEVCGDNAIYFDATNPQDIADKLLYAIKRDEMADRDIYKKYAKDNFQWEATLNPMHEFFKDLK